MGSFISVVPDVPPISSQAMGDLCNSQDPNYLLAGHSGPDRIEPLFGQHLYPFRYSTTAVDVNKVGVTTRRSSGEMKHFDSIDRLYALRLPHLDNNSVTTFANDFLAISKVTLMWGVASTAVEDAGHDHEGKI